MQYSENGIGSETTVTKLGKKTKPLDSSAVHLVRLTRSLEVSFAFSQSLEDWLSFLIMVISQCEIIFLSIFEIRSDNNFY